MEYNRAISLLLGNLETAAVVVATHNAESVLKALETMKNHATDWNHPHINFAQLMGISDHLTLGLASKGVNINKLLPYGPVDNVMPYLIRYRVFSFLFLFLFFVLMSLPSPQ